MTPRVRTLLLAVLLAAAVYAVWLCCAAATLCILALYDTVTTVNRHTADTVLAPRPASSSSASLQWTVLAADVDVDHVCRLIKHATNIRLTVHLVVPHTPHNTATAVFTTRASMTVTLLPHQQHQHANNHTRHTLFSAAQMAYLNNNNKRKNEAQTLHIVVFDSTPKKLAVVDALCAADATLSSSGSVEIVVDASSEKPLQIGKASLDIYVTKRIVVLRVLARHGITTVLVITSGLCFVVSSCLAVAFVVVRLFGTSFWATVVSSRSTDDQTISSVQDSAVVGDESSSTTGVASPSSTASNSVQHQSKGAIKQD